MKDAVLAIPDSVDVLQRPPFIEGAYELAERDIAFAADDDVDADGGIDPLFGGQARIVSADDNPDLGMQRQLFAALQPEEIGVQLTEGDMMDPEASVSALVFHHSQAEYFSVGAEVPLPS